MKKFFGVDRANLKELIKREAGSFVGVTVGTLLVCFAIAALVEPYRFANTGLTGIALITNYLWGISPVWVLTAGNLLLLLCGWKALSPRFAAWTLYNSILTSVALPLFEMYPYPLIQNPILATLLGGAVAGLGMGILFREGASSGGMDVAAAAAKKILGMDIGTASFFVNVMILASSLVAVDLERVLLGALCLYVESVTLDSVLKSFDRRTQMTIISSRPDEISRFVMNSLDRTATLVSAKGAYSRAPIEMMVVILTRRQSMELRRFIYQVDPEAFVIMSGVTEVLGEGFKSPDADA